jgi:hypothetical protein
VIGMGRRTRPRLAIVGFALALLPLSGCGGDSSPAADAGGGAAEAADPATTDVLDVPTEAPAGAPDIDPCSLVGNEEMAGILSEQLPNDEGAVTVTSEAAAGFGNPTCTYMWTRDTWGAGSGKEFTISVLPPDDLEFTAGFGDRVPIDGVGDEAFEQEENYFARVGDVVVHVVNLQETPEASVAVLTAAAAAL